MRSLLVAVVLLPLTAAAQSPPLPWRDPAPLARLFLQPTFDSGDVVEPGECELQGAVTEASNVLRAGDPRGLSVDFDYESTDVRAGVRCGVAPRFDVSVDAPVRVDWGGFLDGFIAVVEGSVRALNPLRRDHPAGGVRYRFVRDGDGALIRGHPAAGLGDLWASAGLALVPRSEDAPGVTLRASVKAPTARRSLGSGTTDLGVSLITGWVRRPFGFWAQLDVGWPLGRLQPLDLPLGPYANVQVAASFGISDRLSLNLQAAVHSSPLRGTDIPPFRWPTIYVLGGIGYRFPGAGELQLGATENLFSYQRGADFTVLIAWRSTIGAR